VDSDSELFKSKRKKSEKKNSPAVSSYVPIGNIKDFHGNDNCSQEEARNWLKTFNYVGATANWSNKQKLYAFYLHMRGNASHWFNQLSSRNKKSWKNLEKVFKSRYCKREVMGAKFRYHNASRKADETPRMYLDRLNSLAYKAGVKYQPGEREARDHVTQFIITVKDEQLAHSLLMNNISSAKSLDQRLEIYAQGNLQMKSRGEAMGKMKSTNGDQAKSWNSSTNLRAAGGQKSGGQRFGTGRINVADGDEALTAFWEDTIDPQNPGIQVKRRTQQTFMSLR
jgi:hypothetical protein